MPKFVYQAIDTAGRLLKGSAIAASESELEGKLLDKELTLVSSQLHTDGFLGKSLLGERIRQRDIIEFYHRLYQTLELGLPMLSALEENAVGLPSRPMRRIVDEIRIAIENGNTFTTAMSKFPKAFGKLDLAIIRMGEETGVLPKCLKDLSAFLEWKEEIRSTVKRAAIYPSFVIIVIVAVIGVWVGYVLPQLAGLLVQMGVELPTMTRFILNLSQFFRNWWAVITTAMVLSAIAVYVLQLTEKGGVLFHRHLLNLPVVGGVISNIAMARLSHNFATMYQAGMSINGIFEILSANVLGNRYLEMLLKKAFDAVQRGDAISDGFDRAGGFPPLLLGAIRNGETTGTLDVCFERLGNYYDREAKRTVQTMIATIEPMSIIMLGGVFGLIVLSILLPLYDVIGKF
ncbi:type II secretion system F family protein [Desulfosarcina sp.]|uniref:type II secretion system F family protein n=1 Tax=Desulfosarcina sp. TaxID=2027861 RepID=UPI0029B294A5|nr:type II secretion system F family protein [Desulfosarcina sp.]MDX2453412.1 type II secretion system F family protein [Desulfosarcina sp.]MDX2491129.1 type II secretion system F family protein [Desulfosarcina sp.]